MEAFSTGPSAADDSRRAARELYDYLSSGEPPVPIAAPSLALQFGEFCVAEAPVSVLQWATGDGTYLHKSGGYWGGGLVGLLALRGAKAIGNSRRRRRAERESQGQWREADHGRVFLTSRRFVTQGAQQVDMWFPYIQAVEYDRTGLHLQLHGWTPLRLQAAEPDYWFVLFNQVAYGRLVFPSAPPAA
jgi:hypothetical protein